MSAANPVGPGEIVPARGAILLRSDPARPRGARLGQACDTDDADAYGDGTVVCTADGAGVTCGPETATDIEEVCDGADNDCDGQTDDGLECGGGEDAGTPDAGSPDAGSPDARSPDAASPDAASPDAGSAVSSDTGTPGGLDAGAGAVASPPAAPAPSGGGCSASGRRGSAPARGLGWLGLLLASAGWKRRALRRT